ncbi:MAG: PAS domain-containing sensor histidine kinase [Aquisalinus sp.]|nr:PAS domain-containing sensor histidine kinase [Aquisalinus sp.]
MTTPSVSDSSQSSTGKAMPLRPRAPRIVAAALIVLALSVFGLTSYFFLTFIDGAPTYIALLFAIAVVFVAILSVFVFGRLWQVWRNRRVGTAGSIMHFRLVGILSAIAIVPTVIAFFFSAFILQAFSDEFFVDRVAEANSTALELANTYFQKSSDEMGFDLVRVAFDLNVLEQSGRGISDNPIGFRQYLFGQALIRDWAAIYLLDGDKRILARVVTVPGDFYQLPALETFDAIDGGSDVASRFNFDAQDRSRLDIFRAVLKIRDYEGGYLIAYKGEQPAMANGLLAVRDFRDNNAIFKSRLDNLRSAFTTGYSLLALIILLLAVWTGLLIATAIVSPIGKLAAAAETISAGNLATRVDVAQGDGELQDLGRTFNHMAGQLQTQRDDLISSNKQSDSRRRFIEAVLSGVSAGVLGVSEQGKITAANRTAADFLGVQITRMTGVMLSDLSAELYGLFEQAKIAAGKEAGGQLELTRNGQERILNVRVSADKSEDTINYVITFDDISELVSAQRNAAWGDVARRIAHEIKNPLTPIQLSAERLKRKYGDEIVSNREVFDRCTDTIIRHVNDIGRMVNEFSSFARMPEAVMARENLREVVKSAVFPFQVAHPDIEFTMDFPEEELTAYCDGRLMVQACTNLVKNAAESIEEKKSRSADEFAGKLQVSVYERSGNAVIEVIDNGIGLPDAVRHKLTEPYMTTREKGTGLGLAIVRKVIEEHEGTIKLKDSAKLGETGASVSLHFPLRKAGSQKETSEEKSVSPSREAV